MRSASRSHCTMQKGANAAIELSANESSTEASLTRSTPLNIETLADPATAGNAPFRPIVVRRLADPFNEPPLRLDEARLQGTQPVAARTDRFRRLGSPSTGNVRFTYITELPGPQRRI